MQNSNNLTLAKENIMEWKAEFGKRIKEISGLEGYENTASDEDWLEYYEGFTVSHAISDEISHWEP